MLLRKRTGEEYSIYLSGVDISPPNMSKAYTLREIKKECRRCAIESNEPVYLYGFYLEGDPPSYISKFSPHRKEHVMLHEDLI